MLATFTCPECNTQVVDKLPPLDHYEAWPVCPNLSQHCENDMRLEHLQAEKHAFTV